MLGEQPEGRSRSSLIPPPEKDLQATDPLREDVDAVGLGAQLDVGQPDVQLQANEGQEDLKSAVSINQTFKELQIFYFNCIFGLSAWNLGDDLRKVNTQADLHAFAIRWPCRFGSAHCKSAIVSLFRWPPPHEICMSSTGWRFHPLLSVQGARRAAAP